MAEQSSPHILSDKSIFIISKFSLPILFPIMSQKTEKYFVNVLEPSIMAFLFSTCIYFFIAFDGHYLKWMAQFSENSSVMSEGFLGSHSPTGRSPSLNRLHTRHRAINREERVSWKLRWVIQCISSGFLFLNQILGSWRQRVDLASVEPDTAFWVILSFLFFFTFFFFL